MGARNPRVRNTEGGILDLAMHTRSFGRDLSCHESITKFSAKGFLLFNIMVYRVVDHQLIFMVLMTEQNS